MTIRTFGAVSGPGTRVREATPSPPIAQGPFGTTVLVGHFRAGQRYMPRFVTSWADFVRNYGGLFTSSDAPLAVKDYFDAGGGAAGGLWVMRVIPVSVDGGARGSRAQMKVWARDVSGSAVRYTANRASDSVGPTQIGVLASIGAGARYGRERVVQTAISDPSAAITDSRTIDLSGGTGWMEGGHHDDEWVGGTLYIDTFPSLSWKIESNTDAGVFTIVGRFPTEVQDSATAAVVRLEREAIDSLTRKADKLSVMFRDSEEGSGKRFSAYLFADSGDLYDQWTEVSVEEGTSYFLQAMGGEDFGGDHLVWTSVGSALDGENPLLRPANLCETIHPSWDGNVQVKINTVRWTKTAGAGATYIDPAAVTHGASPRRGLVNVSFSSSTEFTVTMELEDDATQLYLGAGTVGTSFNGGPYGPTFTVALKPGGTAPSNGGDMYILYRPLPTDLAGRGGYVTLGASPSDAGAGLRVRVRDNTADEVGLLYLGELSSLIQAATVPSHEGTTAGPYDVSGTAKTFIYSPDADGAITLTLTISGAASTAAQVVADLNAVELSRVSGVAANKRVEFYVADSGKPAVRLLNSYGTEAELTIGAGTLNAIVGFTAGDYNGEDASRIVVEWRQDLTGGSDPVTGASDFQIAWEGAAETFLRTLAEANTGLVKVCMPGVVDAGAQAAMMAYAAETNAHAVCEVASTHKFESARAWHLANLTVGEAQDYHSVLFPSYLQRPNPYGSGLHVSPISGWVLGQEAKAAVEQRGYHRAPAGLAFPIPWAKRLPDILWGTALGNVSGYLEAANAYGFRPIRVKDGRFYVYGDRIPGYEGKLWLHKRLTVSHIGRVLLTNSDRFHFAINDSGTWAELKGDLRGLFQPWVADRWFVSASGGVDVEDYVIIRVDATTNTAAVRQSGVLASAIGFEVVDTAEVVEFDLAPGLITVRE